MQCVCAPKVAELVATMEASDVALSLPPVPAGAAELAVMANTAASLSAAAEMAAGGALEAALSAGLPAPSMEGVLAMEAMAQVGGAMGIEMTAPSANAELSLAAGSLNVAAPALGELNAAMGPAMEPLSGLPLPLSINAAISSALGISLSAPGAPAAIEAAFAAALEGAASMDIAMDAAVELGMAARALNAAVALGLQMGAPGGGLPAFAADLAATANLEVPPLLMSAGEMGELSGGLGELGLVNAALSGGEMEATAPSIEAGMAAMSMNMEAAVEATASMAAEMNASAAMAANLGAAVAAAFGGALGGGGEMAIAIAAAAGVGGMELGGLPAMGDMSIAATMCQSFEGATGTPLLSGTPCPNIFCVAGR